ncbi:MAG: hypothetical protein LHW48_02145 [Candidatus Cloacimonetes bacterium]|jgi:hypothetical protein|nr:hypothetical protein [Candidatus Cloacimonadota bacterium]HOY84020.1 hypothetical protein [Candidatus Syntrophosphaera sp.]
MDYIEKDLELFPESTLRVIKFDDPHTHGLTSFDMKAVDFILEYPDKYVYLELKDPDSPDSRAGGVRRFIADYKTGALKTKLSKKYRDTFIYRWAQNKADKPIHYYVLICWDFLDVPKYNLLTDSLKKHLPRRSEKWRRKFAEKCVVLSLTDWNKQFPDCIIRRRSLMGHH